MANFNKQPDPMKHFRVMALELSKIAPPKNNSMDHHQTWCIKLSDNVCKHNLSTTFNNQPDLMKHFGELYGPYLAEIKIVHSVFLIFFNGSS